MMFTRDPRRIALPASSSRRVVSRPPENDPHPKSRVDAGIGMAARRSHLTARGIDSASLKKAFAVGTDDIVDVDRLICEDKRGAAAQTRRDDATMMSR